MAYENLCISCFADKGGADACPHCGYLESGERKRILLPARYMLQGRYVVGEMLSSDKNTICYKALDTAQNAVVEVQEFFPREYATRESQTQRIVPAMAEYAKNVRKDVNNIHKNAQRMRDFVGEENIVNIFDSFLENDTVYIVSEYLEGMLVSDYLHANGDRLDLDTTLSIMLPVLDGLGRIHAAGLVHRALTPKNILITTDNKIKIINFRFLKEASPYQPNQMTVYFTPGYAPPEQYSSNSRSGPFSDIYSVGATIYRMLAGKAPRDALARLSGNDLPTLSELDPGIPKHVSDTVQKAMEMNEDMRIKSAADFKKYLRGEKEIVVIPNGNGLDERKKMKRMITALAVLAAIAVAVWIFVLTSK